MKNHVVSAVITVHNNEQTVGEAIESFLEQTFCDLEIVVVDDGSTDATRRVVEQRYGSRVRIVSQPNRGSAAARNAGIRSARGKYLAFLDGDDMSLPERVRMQVRVLEDRPEVGLVYGNIYLMDKGGKRLRLRGGTGRYKSGEVLHDLVIKNFVPFSTIMVRRECFADIGLFDESIRSSEDWHMLVRLATMFKFYYLDEPLVIYRIHAGSKTADLKTKAEAFRQVQARIFAENDFGSAAKHLRRLSDASLKYGLLGISLRYGYYWNALRYGLEGLFTAPEILLYYRHEILSRLRWTCSRGLIRDPKDLA